MQLPIAKKRKRVEEALKRRKLVVEEPEEEQDEEEEIDTSGTAKPLDIAAIQKETKRLLKYSTYEPEHEYWLDTGSPEVNAVMGSKKLGLPYGKIFELNGLEPVSYTHLRAHETPEH